MKKNLIYLALSLFANNATAQISGEKLYFPYVNPPVVNADNRQLAYAWAGGLKNPQFSVADMNQDGIKDMVIFDPISGVKVFINTSSVSGSPKYVYHAEYTANFPEVNGYVKLEDYNRDGVPDLIYRGFSGVTPMRGYYADSQLHFDFNTKFQGYKGLYYLTGGSGMVNVYVAPNDLPGMVDVDGDGDLDFLSYDVSGTSIYFYRNCQVEEGLPKDSIKICVKDGCWGKTAQFYQRSMALGIYCGTAGQTCKGCDDPSAGGKTTHSGNTLCLLDIDNDGDYDVLNGNVSFSDIQFLKNGKTDLHYVRDSMIAQDTLWGSNGKTVFMPQQPAAYWLDMDNDGDKDLIFSPFIPNTGNNKCVQYFKNTGTNHYPNFVYQSDSLFVSDMIDLGSGSAPTFYDYNKDGKADLFVGSEGFYQPSNGSTKASIYYFENTSTSAANPSFNLISRDFLNLGSANIIGSSLAFGDLDGDGKDDLIIGKADGKLTYFHNSAASATMQPVWQNPIQVNDQNGAMDVGDFAAPFIYDINKDGKNDLVVGCQLGRLFYYKNLGGASAPNYTPNYNLITDTLGGIEINEYGSNYTYAAPFIGKIDNSGKDYLLIGSKSGILYRYDNFQSGNINTKYVRVDSAYSLINVHNQAKPTVADIDGDGIYEMAIGNSNGGVLLFKQYYNTYISDKQLANGAIKIYPNPANNMINISWLPAIGLGDVHISLISVTGQKMYDGTIDASRTNAQIDVSAIPAGTYYCIVRTDETQASSPVCIMH